MWLYWIMYCMVEFNCPWKIHYYFCCIGHYLESMDTTRRVPHLRPTRDAVARATVLRLRFFFFFFSDSHQRGSIRLRFASNRADSAISGCISRWLIRLIWPEKAETGRNRPWIWPEKPKLSPQRHSNVFLAIFFLCFVNQGIVMCFLIIF